MTKALFITLIKLMVAAALFFAPLIVVRKMAAQNKDESILERYSHPKPGIGDVYFIGSSRTRRSINDSMLNSQFNGFRFMNIGIDNGTFLFNKVIADKILANSKPSVLFIEVSVINARLPGDYRLLAESEDIINGIAPLMKKASIDDTRKILWPLMEKAALSKTRLGPEIRALFGKNDDLVRIGFVAESGSISKPPSVIKEKLFTRENVPTSVHPLYGEIVNELINKANANGVRLIFFISPALEVGKEQEVLTAVFNSIPHENKLLYSSRFLGSLNDKRLFNDETHLNKRGAVVFTNYLAAFLRRSWLH